MLDLHGHPKTVKNWNFSKQLDLEQPLNDAIDLHAISQDTKFEHYYHHRFLVPIHQHLKQIERNIFSIKFLYHRKI